MEQDKQNLLEMIDRPAFLVKDGVILYTNQMAKNRMISAGTPVEELLETQTFAYQEYRGGCLYLTLNLGGVHCGATVTRQSDGDIFLLDRDMDQMQLQTLALAGQQLRQPLGNVLVLADQLLPQLQDNPEQKALAGQLSRNLFQLLRITSNMADGELYGSQRAVSFENTEMASFLREVIRKAQDMLESSDVKLGYVGLDNAVFSLVNREQLQRAIHNLISNAVKFSPKGGSVQVSATRTGNRIAISVTNAGNSIPAHVKDSLFRRYQREASIEDSRYGLGLGMTLVRSAAANHQGAVLVDEQNGTRVTMTITVQKSVPSHLRSPIVQISDYLGGRDSTLVELSDTLPATCYENLF